MTSRQLVQKTLAFESPKRIPRQLWTLPWADANHPEWLRRIQKTFPDDIVSAPEVYREAPERSGDRYKAGTYIDEWGCVFQNVHDGVIGIVRDPLIKSWEDLDRFVPPESVLTVDTEGVNAFCKQTDRYVIGGTGVRPFERLQFLRTMEQALIDLLEQPPELIDLLDRMHAHYLKEIEVWTKTDVDGISFMDDWGTQNALMVSPDIFRKLFKTKYREYADIAHKNGKALFFHSDGWIVDIIPDLIEAGIDALNSQIFCMGVEALGERFRGRITFWGEMDRQHILARGNPEKVKLAVYDVFEHLYADGGVIAQCEFGPGARPENVMAVFKAWDDVKGSENG